MKFYESKRFGKGSECLFERGFVFPVSHALGDLAGGLIHGKTVKGYQGREGQVLRHIQDAQRIVVVESVNLAATTAEDDLYALISRLRSVQAQGKQENRHVELALGYLTSPHGLNGERPLIEWAQKDLDCLLYDLLTQQDNFQGQPRQAIANVYDDLGMMQNPSLAEAG